MNFVKQQQPKSSHSIHTRGHWGRFYEAELQYEGGTVFSQGLLFQDFLLGGLLVWYYYKVPFG